MSRHYSYSQLKMHRDCPRQYWYKYLSDEKPALPHALFGQGQQAEDDLLHMMEHDPGKVHEQHPKLAHLLETFFEDGTREPLAITFPSYRVECRTDYHYVNSTSGYLIDFKLAMLPADDLQLRIYALALHKVYGVSTVRAWYYIIERGYYASYHYDTNDFEAIEAELLAFCDAIHEKGSEQELFPIRPTINCERCPYAQQCEVADAYSVGNIGTEKGASEAYGKMKRAEAVAAQIKEELAAYMERDCLTELYFEGGGRLKWSLAKPSLKEYKK